MNTSQLLARAGSVITAIAAVWNVVVSAMWIMSLIWVVVGLLWIVPLLLGLVELALATSVVLGRKPRGTLMAPLIGMVVSVMNFNFLALVLDLISFSLAVGSVATRPAYTEEVA